MPIYVNNIADFEYDLSMVERPSIPTPIRNVEYYEIEGRHGTLHESKTFSDIELTVTFNLIVEEDIKKSIRQIKAWLLSAETLFFSDEDDVYYIVKNTVVGNIENEIDVFGEFEVTFTLDPFAYAKYSLATVTNQSKKIINPGTFESEPIVKVYGSGTIILTINGTTVTLKDVNNYVVVNCEMKECYKDSTRLNNKMSGSFFVLRRGLNDISWTGNVSKIEVEGRWRYL